MADLRAYLGKQGASDDKAASEAVTYFGWQVCSVDEEGMTMSDALLDAEHRSDGEKVMQMLAIALDGGKNLYRASDGESFAVMIARRTEGADFEVLGPNSPDYARLARLASEQLTAGNAQGVIAKMPNGTLVVIGDPRDAASVANG